MSGSVKPDLVVGVDFGQTCTGVSYTHLASGDESIRWIQRWPGRKGVNENKVPTVLVYPIDPKTGKTQEKASSWGFKAESATEQNQDHRRTKEWFKTYLDVAHFTEKRHEDPENTPVLYEDVKKWYTDFLAFIYEHIKLQMLPVLLCPWEQAKIEFIFSVPTTWSSNTTIETFRSIIRYAGFGACSFHIVTIGLTEAEAAAVHVSTESPALFNDEDVLLICDAGGGTTDLSTLRVQNASLGAQSLKQLKELDVVNGENIGSAAIDFDFEQLVRNRLEKADPVPPLPSEASHISWSMMKHRDFQSNKCGHGDPDETSQFLLSVPGTNSEFSNAGAGIENGEMCFAQYELRSFFDRQIQKLINNIDRQLANLRRKLPDQQVSYLILSGGLSQSAYVQDRLKFYYSADSNEYPNAQFMQVRVAPDPQLAVCKGLIIDRIRQLIFGQSVIGWRCCRASYGIVCRKLYDKSNPDHLGRPTEKDEKNGKQYVPSCVAWFIHKGEAVSIEKPIVYPFSLEIDPADERIFPTKIVMSNEDPLNLPYQIGPGVTKLCDIISDLSQADEKRFIVKNKRFWKRGEHYFQIDYEVKVLFGPADLHFELWFNEQKLSKDKPIKVEWEFVPVPSPHLVSDIRTSKPKTMDEAIWHQKMKSSLKVPGFISRRS